MNEENNGNGRLLARVDERTKLMDEKLDRVLAQVEKHDERIGKVEQEQARVDERIGTANRWQAIYTTFAAIVAGIVGANR